MTRSRAAMLAPGLLATVLTGGGLLAVDSGRTVRPTAHSQPPHRTAPVGTNEDLLERRSLAHARASRTRRLAAVRPPVRKVAPRVVTPPVVRLKKRVSVPATPLGSAAWADTSNAKAVSWCESKGDIRAVSPSGKYRGKWQFDGPTWRSVGGTGDPIDASEAQQDYRAWLLWKSRGWQPWACRSAI